MGAAEDDAVPSSWRGHRTSLARELPVPQASVPWALSASLSASTRCDACCTGILSSNAAWDWTTRLRKSWFRMTAFRRALCFCRIHPSGLCGLKIPQEFVTQFDGERQKAQLNCVQDAGTHSNETYFSESKAACLSLRWTSGTIHRQYSSNERRTATKCAASSSIFSAVPEFSMQDDYPLPQIFLSRGDEVELKVASRGGEGGGWRRAVVSNVSPDGVIVHFQTGTTRRDGSPVVYELDMSKQREARWIRPIGASRSSTIHH